jgi:hypothetical protein
MQHHILEFLIQIFNKRSLTAIENGLKNRILDTENPWWMLLDRAIANPQGRNLK